MPDEGKQMASALHIQYRETRAMMLSDWRKANGIHKEGWRLLIEDLDSDYFWVLDKKPVEALPYVSADPKMER